MRSRIRDNGRADNGRVNGRPVLVDFEKKGVYSSYLRDRSSQPGMNGTRVLSSTRRCSRARPSPVRRHRTGIGDVIGHHIKRSYPALLDGAARTGFGGLTDE